MSTRLSVKLVRVTSAPYCWAPQKHVRPPNNSSTPFRQFF